MVQSTVFADRYLLSRRAGAGGMGEVWKAIDQQTGEPVAIKRLHGPEARDAAARFAREARVLSSLSHPHIVRYIAHGASADGAPYLVMEWLEGEDLDARLARGRLSVEESVKLTLRVAEALSAAHAQGVVHRDLKPSNLFLPEGRLEAVKVLDFGIARGVTATRITATGALLGTLAYMAPEQARGEPTVTPGADVFSLGCVLFECLTGEQAFGGEHIAAILSKVLLEETPSARRLSPEVPEALEALLQRMLAKAPEERPRDTGAVTAALLALGEVPSGPPLELLRAPSLTRSEQRAIAVILIGTPAEAEAETVAMAAAPTVDVQGDQALLREAARYGGVGEHLLDGSVVVVISSPGLPTDFCGQAARCALSLRAHAGGRRIALAMGRGERTGRSLGQVIDRVARLSGATVRASSPEGAVVLDEVAAGLLDARFEVREEEGAFTLHGEHALGEGTRRLLGKATPCVGRERELGTLRALFAESVEESTAQAVVVTAPPGAGKSRLAQEFLREVRARGEGVSIWSARGDAQREGSPLGMLGEALRSACGIRESEPLAVRREKLSAQVGAWVSPGERQRVAEFLGELMGAPFPDEDSPPLRTARRDAPLMADQVRAAFRDFLAAACARNPVLVLLEDLHWGDRSTVQMLDTALREHQGAPLFVLALARPEVSEVFPRLWEGRRLHQVRLNELSRRAGERLARHVLGPGADPEAIGRIVRLSEGNAFYLEELLRWTVEGKGADFPETVVAMVESRLGALGEEARRLLRAGSIFGEVFWVGSVAALAGGEAQRSRIAGELLALVEQEVLVRRPESRFQGEEELAFRHALLREGAYAMLTEEDRALGHRLAGEWLEGRGEPDARALAEHFEKGGDGPRAGQHYLRAAYQASWGGDGIGSAMLARRGLSLPLESDLRARLLGVLCEAASWQPDKLASVQREAEELVQVAPRGSAPWAQGMSALLTSAAVGGRVEEILAIAGALSQVEVAPDAADPMALALCTSVYVLALLGRRREVETLVVHFERFARVFEEESPCVAIAFYMAVMVRARINEDPFTALTYGRKIQALARQNGHRRYETLIDMHLAACTWNIGRPDEAERALRALSLSDTEYGLVSAVRPFTLAWLLAERGALEEARAYAEQLVMSGSARGLPLDEARGRWVLAEVLRRADDLEAAGREVEAALAALRAVCPIDVSSVLATKAALRLSQGRKGEALAAAQEGMSRYAATGACSSFFRGGFLRLVHVESLDASGQHEEARAALHDAREWLFSIAARIDEPAYRKSFLENVPENRRTLALAREWLGERVM